MHLKESYFNENSFNNQELSNSLTETFCKHNCSATILLELPAESYFFASTISLKCLINNGYEGIYVSFQRPFKNINGLFEKYQIDTGKVSIIECTNCIDEKCSSKINGVNISKLNIDRLGEIIVNSLKNISNEKKFIYIDSLTTIALYNKTSAIKKFAEILVEIINSKDFENTKIIFNVAEDLCQKKYVKEISSFADDVVNVNDCSKKYTRNIINSDICT